MTCPRSWLPLHLTLVCLVLGVPAVASAMGDMYSETYPYGRHQVLRFVDDSWCGSYYCFGFGKVHGGSYVAISEPSDAAAFAAGMRPDGSFEVVDLATLTCVAASSGARAPCIQYPTWPSLVKAYPELSNRPPTIQASDPDPLSTADVRRFALAALTALLVLGALVYVLVRRLLRPIRVSTCPE